MTSASLEYVQLIEHERQQESINVLQGIIEGICIDGTVNLAELGLLLRWLDQHAGFRTRAPYNELISLIKGALSDGRFLASERDDILRLCERVRGQHDNTAADLQRLQIIIAAIVADAAVTQDELRGLAGWLEQHRHLARCWPYDDIASLVADALAHGSMDAHAQQSLKNLLMEFAPARRDKPGAAAPGMFAR
ncbi:MAG: hypothetical protein V4724_18190 [Pseudomonadota bacterium]